MQEELDEIRVGDFYAFPMPEDDLDDELWMDETEEMVMLQDE